MRIQIILFALFLQPLVTYSQDPFPQMQSTAWSLRVRSANGEHLCSIREGTLLQPVGRDKDAERIQVETNDTKCKKGFVDIRYIRAAKNENEADKNVVVDENGLSLRSDAKVSAETFLCSLPKNTKLKITETKQQSEQTSWIKVELSETPPNGCPSSGWVSSSYVRSNLDFTSLPITANSDDSTTEAKTCTECELGKGGTDGAKAEAVKIWKATRTASGKNPFLEALRVVHKTKKCPKDSDYSCNRGLIQMPLVGKNAGFCGSHHYNPDPPPGVDAYASPLTACALTALAQEWKKKFCPNRSGCTMSWGDISHKKKARFNGHTMHTNGNCVDIRPMRKGGFQDSGLTNTSSGYDRQKTKEFIALAKSMGAYMTLFNDRKAGGSYAPGHHNHLHICFNNNAKTQQACNNLKVDPETCPELQ